MKKAFNILCIALFLLPALAFSQEKKPEKEESLKAPVIVTDVDVIKKPVITEVRIRNEKKEIAQPPKFKGTVDINYSKGTKTIPNNISVIEVDGMPLSNVKKIRIEGRAFNFEAAPTQRASFEKNKTIIKEYKVESNNKLSIDNRFGNIRVNIWKKNEIKVEVEIKAFDISEEKALDLLNSVSINSLQQSTLIKFATQIEKTNVNNSRWEVLRSDRAPTEPRGIQVNYTIFMPAKNSLVIENQHGNINLPEISGAVTINLSYGSLFAEKLLNPLNKIKVAYGSAKIETLKASDLNISYGGLKLGLADDIDANISNSSAKIGRLSGNGALNLRYCGGFKIEEIDKKVKTLNVNAAYSSLSFGFEPSANVDFDVTVSYCGFNYSQEKAVVLTKSPEENSRNVNFTKNFKGQIGKGSDAKVVVNSKYGSVNFH